jgi:WD40 repeat protein
MDGNLRQFDLSNYALKSTIEAGPVEIWQVSTHPLRSQICATGSHSGHVNIWNFDTLAKVDSAKPGTKFTMAVVQSVSSHSVIKSVSDE